MTAEIVTVCPHCRRRNSLQTEVQGRNVVPEAGDLACCFGCGEPAIFDWTVEGGLRLITPQDRQGIEASTWGQVEQFRVLWLRRFRRTNRPT